MRERIWSSLLDNLISEFGKIENYDIEDQRIMSEGKNEFQEFIELVFDTPKRQMERHQYLCIMEEYTQTIVEWAWGISFVKRNKDIFFTHCGFDVEKLLNCYVTVIKRQHGKTEMLVRMFYAGLLSFTSKRKNSKGERENFEFYITSFKGTHASEVFGRICSEIKTKVERYSSKFKFRFTRDYLTITNKHDLTDVRKGVRYEGDIAGLTNKIFFGDEFFLWSDDRANRQLLPQLQVGGTYALLFTTLKGRDHWCAAYIDGDRPAVRLINYAEVCNECLRGPKEGYLDCEHIEIKVQAHWIDSGRRNLLLRSMSLKNASTEMLNITSRPTNNYIPKEDLLKHMVNRSRATFAPTEFISFTDPSMTSTNGSSTATVITASRLVKGIGNYGFESTMVYLSKSITDSPSKIVDFIINDWIYFIDHWKLEPGVHTIYAFVESNTINHGEDIYKRIEENWKLKKIISLIMGIGPTRIGGVKSYKRYGIAKVGGMELKYIRLLYSKLYKNRLSIHVNCCTKIKRIGVAEFIDQLVTECSRVRIKNVEGCAQPKVISTRGENNKIVHNDLYMAFVSNLYGVHLLKSSNNEGYRNQMRSREDVASIIETSNLTRPVINTRQSILSTLTSRSSRSTRMMSSFY